MSEETYRFERIRTGFAEVVGFAICEPKLRLGRRRHDGTCDRCGDAVNGYGAERLDFPLNDLSPDASTTCEKLRAMLDAEYVLYCLECAVEIEREERRIEESAADGTAEKQSTEQDR